MDEPRKPSTALASVAAAVVLVALVGTPLGVLATAAATRTSVVHAFREMGGPAAALVILGALAGAAATAALLFFEGRGSRVPTALVALTASLPWLGGLAGSALGMRMVEQALTQVDASMRAALLAQGISEAGLARVAGGFSGATLLAAASLGLALGSLAQRAPARRALGASIAVLALPALVALVIGLVGGHRGLGGVLGVLIASASVLTVALAGAGAGRDEPHARSGALAAASGVLGVLALVLVSAALSTLDLLAVLRAFAGASADSRAALALRAADELAAARRMDAIAIALAVLPAVALAAWSAVRARPDTGRIAGGVALVVVAGLLAWPSFSRWDATLDEGSAPWAGESSFVATEVSGTEDPGEPLVVDTRRIVVRSNDAMDLASLAFAPAQKTLASKIRARLPPAPPDEPPPRPRTQRETVEDLLAPRLLRSPFMRENRTFRDAPGLSIAFDARVAGDRVTQVLAAALEAGARSILLVGLSPDAATTPERRTNARVASPLLAGIAEAPRARFVLLPPALLPDVAASDPVLFHGTVENRSLVVRTRPDADRPGFTVSAASSERPSRENDDPDRIVYIAWRPDTTAGDLVRIADRVGALGYVPLLVTGPFPATPPHPRPRRPGAGSGSAVSAPASAPIAPRAHPSPAHPTP
ncbi:MAG: hypothetical protein IT379_22170 [Deltaproteobacteria bacterium]|nr:hypothetical protein [Deltaproteobacteria bacterium]